MHRIIKLLGILIVGMSVLHAEKRDEAYYQNVAAEACGGETEVHMPDGSRCDIVTEDFAIEVDFSRKFKEAVGQSLNYAFQSNKRAGIVLIIDEPTDSLKLMSLIEHFDLPITVWTIDTETLKFERLNTLTSTLSNKSHPDEDR